MQRRNRILTFVAIGSIVATGVMIWLLWGDLGGRESKRRGGVVEHNTSPTREQGGTDGAGVTVMSTPRHKPNLPGVLERFPPREPRDSPATIALRREQSERVVVLLDELMAAESSTDRYRINRELQNLLRKLGRRVDPQTKRRLLEMLITVDVKWRPLIGEAVGSMHGDVDVAKALVGMLRERPEERYTRHAILTALTKIQVVEVRDDLFGLLRKAHPDEHLIVRALGQIATPEDSKQFADMLDKPLRPDTRAELERVLTTKRNVPGVMNAVVKQLADAKSPDTKRSLLKIVGLSRKPEHSEMVRKIAGNEKDPLVRAEAYKALGKMGDEKSGEFLLEVLGSADANERRFAAQALREIKNPKTVDLFMDRWDALGEEGRRAAMNSAAQQAIPTPSQTKRALRDGLHDDQMLVRRAALQVLGKRGRDEYVRPILAVLGKAKHPAEWGAAFKALQKIGTKSAAEDAISMLHVVPDKRRRDYYMGIFEKILARHRR